MLNGHSDELIGFKRELVEIIDSDVLAKSRRAHSSDRCAQ